MTEHHGPHSATFSDDRRYRYELTRYLSAGPEGAFVMLNPSTASAFKDDPTVRRCVRFALDWGWGTLHLVNLFAIVSSDPAVLRTDPDPVGPENEHWLRYVASICHDHVVLAWGELGSIRCRDTHVTAMLSPMTKLLCLGVTKSGRPRHPLYLPKSLMSIPYDDCSATFVRLGQ